MAGYLAHAPSDVLAQLLVDDSQGTVVGGVWPVYVNNEPDSPDNCITVYDTTTINLGIDMVSGNRAELHGIQIRVRSSLFQRGYPRVNGISQYLDQDAYKKTVTLGDYTYTVQYVDRRNTIRLGTEPSSKRQLWVINAHMSLWMCCG